MEQNVYTNIRIPAYPYKRTVGSYEYASSLSVIRISNRPGLLKLRENKILQKDIVYYESRKRKLKTRLIYEYRSNERLKN